MCGHAHGLGCNRQMGRIAHTTERKKTEPGGLPGPIVSQQAKYLEKP